METRFGNIEVSYTTRGIATYRLEMWHDGLKKHRVIKGNDSQIIERKARLQAYDWMEKWLITENKNLMREVKNQKKEYLESQKDLAAERTSEAQSNFASLQNILNHTLTVNDAIDWENLKDHAEFSEPSPKLEPLEFPHLPEPNSDNFKPILSFWDRLFSSRKERKMAESAKMFDEAHSDWKRKIAHRAEQQQNTENQFAAQMEQWAQRRDSFLADQAAANEAVDRKRHAFEARDPDAIYDYCDMVLSNSEYPDWIQNEWNLAYGAENGILVIDYSLPNLEQIPRLLEVRYVQARDAFTEKYLSGAQLNKLYDSLVYQIALRTIHELFEADTVDALAAVVFNGIVTSVDRATGHETKKCILSLQASKTEFLAINLAKVDPKACFKALKGVGSSKLHSLTPVPPILQIHTEDERFIPAKAVSGTLDESINLAAMDWEDFEHLVREIFEQEFATTGGEVKVTKASRDGGVDAIAFDPDPIRGGKIVIQAKRYTNTVGVAAVRDLYGTVMNEGATKGILVTTSDYGPDAYGFAKDKPLTLLNGANLLHLLEKHGTRAKIDLHEAKKLMKN